VKKHTRSIRLLVGIALIAIFLLTSTFLAANAAEDTIPALESDRVEYSPEVMLTEDDLPGFHLAAETEVVGHLACQQSTCDHRIAFSNRTDQRQCR